jgi:hypothetical protein
MTPNEVALNDVMKETADAIREKTGKSDLIAPMDFAEEIKSISAAGASGSKMRYFKVVRPLPSAGGGNRAIYGQMKQVTRCEENGEVSISSGCYDSDVLGKTPIAYGLNLDMKVTGFSGEITTVGELLAGNYDDPSFFEEIAEEQFYDLNTLLSE